MLPRMRRVRRLVLVMLAASCRRETPVPPALDIAEPAPLPSAEKITCRVGPKQTMLPLDDEGLHVRFVTGEKNVVAMFGRDVATGEHPDATLPDAIGRFADGRAGEPWIDVEAKVTSPDGQHATAKLSLHVDAAMNARLDAARGKPMLFSGETQAASANKVAWVHPSGGAPYVIGDGRWRDIDLVAFETATHVVGKVCGSVPNGWNQTTRLASHDKSHVEVFDRRTGKRTDDTTIEGEDTCASERDGASASNDAAIRAWVASKLSR